MTARTSINQCYQTTWRIWSDFVGRMLRISKITHLEMMQRYWYFHSSSLKQRVLIIKFWYLPLKPLCLSMGKERRMSVYSLLYVTVLTAGLWRCRISGGFWSLKNPENSLHLEVSGVWSCLAQLQIFIWGVTERRCLGLAHRCSSVYISARGEQNCEFHPESFGSLSVVDC